jgi:hypothetical protein
MKSFKEYFYLKENVLTDITDIKHIFTSNIVHGNINLQSQRLAILPNWSNIEVIGHFDCSNNRLKTLIGSAKVVDGSFYCWSNKLITLIGAPSSVGENFICGYNKLENLEGAPKRIGLDFKCHNSSNLTSLKDNGIEYIGGDMSFKHCPNIQEDQWQYLPVINGALITDKDLNRNEYLILHKLQALGRIGELRLIGNIEQSEDDDDPFNL